VPAGGGGAVDERVVGAAREQHDRAEAVCDHVRGGGDSVAVGQTDGEHADRRLRALHHRDRVDAAMRLTGDLAPRRPDRRPQRAP
jgi:hypothetical protein